MSDLTPAPGIYPGLPREAYMAWEAANHSTLRWFARSPAHVRQYRLAPPPPTAAMELGTGVHLAVLEPLRFPVECIRAPKISRRSLAGKAAAAAFAESTSGRLVLDEDDHDLCVRLSDAVWAHELARAFLEAPGANEVSALWRDHETQLLCKGRLDAVRSLWDWTFLIDLKTAADASPNAFSRASESYGYAEQAAFYLDGLAALEDRPRRFVHIVVETSAPYVVVVYEMDDEAISEGRRRYRHHLKTYADCLFTRTWGGYGDGILPLSLPRWAFKRTEER